MFDDPYANVAVVVAIGFGLFVLYKVKQYKRKSKKGASGSIQSRGRQKEK